MPEKPINNRVGRIKNLFIMTKNLNFSGLLFLVVVLTIFVFSSCRKDKLEDVEKVHQETEIQTNADLEFFLSREKTYDLLAPAAFNWERPIDQITYRYETEINELQDAIVDVNAHLSDKYVNRLINTVGYPFWDASILELLEDGGFTLFTPVFDVGSNKINALFSFTITIEDKIAYDLVTRNELADSSIELKDPNFLSKVSLFKHFDGLLFDYQPSIYEDWQTFTIATLDCYEIKKYSLDGLIGNLDFGSCSLTCYDELLNSSILDTPAEIIWARGNCSSVSMINNFLQYSNSDFKIELAELFVIVGMANIYSTTSQMENAMIAMEQDLTNEDVNWLLNNPILLMNLTADVNEQTNVNYFFNSNNINRFCSSLFNLQSGIIPANPNNPSSLPQVYFESGVSGFNLSWVRSTDQMPFSHSTNYLYLYIEQQCINPFTNYSEILGSAVRNAYASMQILVDDGTITNNNIGFALGSQIKLNLAMLYDDCSNNNLDAAKAQTWALLKENIEGVGSNLNSYQPITALTIDDICP